MNRTLRIDPADAVPLWRQVEDGVRNLVAVGVLAHGASVPSVRELARELRINPATVSKAYQRLVDAGVLEVRRGQGTFVAEKPPELGKPELRRRLGEAADRYVAVAVTLDAKRDEAVGEVETAWKRIDGGKGGQR